MENFKNLLLSARPLQWSKNLAVFAAIFFGGSLFDETLFFRSVLVFFSFCLASSASYYLNDLIDAKADQYHLRKRQRPIAAGKIPAGLVLTLAFLFSILALFFALLLSKTVFVAILSYLIVQLAYNLYLKKVVMLELMLIAFGFMIRVFAGSFATNINLSSWIILTVLMLSLFLAIGKRRSEVTLLGDKAPSHRATLASYPINLLDGLVFLSATSSLLTYSLFTFNQPAQQAGKLFLPFLPQTLEASRWPMITIPIVIYGIFRYLYLIFEKKEGESPEKILLSDKPLLATVLIWVFSYGILIYFFPLT